ncbi:MAG: fluoride efflux transporter CrcB [Bacteroidota bacterium]
MKYIYLIAGGSIGTLLRFLTSSWMLEAFPASKFPWGTFLINLSGSLLIGFFAGINQSAEFNIDLRLFLFAGLLGGFTTYSGYALETFHLIKSDNLTLALVYILSTTLLGVLLAAAGFWLSSVITSAK